MVRTSVLNDALNAINNAERAGKRQVLIRPSSKVIVKFLTVMQRHGYIGEFEEVDDHRNGKIVVQLNGRLNKTGVINPRYNVQLRDLEKWVVQLLPSRQFGYVVLTTSAGIMDHEEARRKHVADAATGEYKASIPSPTGIPSDPALTGYGEDQSKQLADRIRSLHPPIDVIYSSPYYRCLQTIRPVIQRLPIASKTSKTVKVEYGLSEFYGRAPWEHPSPASFPALRRHFTFLDPNYSSVASPPPRHGETLMELHDRVAYTLDRIIDTLDADPSAPRTLLICTHAAPMIAIGRTLTGYMPVDPTTEDFRCYTCSLSKFARRRGHVAVGRPSGGLTVPPPPLSPPPPLTRTGSLSESEENNTKQNGNYPDIENRWPVIDWQGGNGVRGGWECILNADCSYLSGGEERGCDDMSMLKMLRS